MKILSLYFKNINSLKGEHKINFNENPIDDSGIFAITGPTGSGKSSILDAISVALYGQTPRLNRGKDIQEIMTRFTGDSFSEVEFLTSTGIYRSKWSLHRSGKKYDGKFQNAKMELSKPGKNGEYEIIEEKIKNVIGKIEDITGLDYDRFSRSVMLAQGSFAAFLKSDENERAELLEKMTGTEIYSEISIKTFERSKEEKIKYENMKNIIDSFKLMDNEEKERLLNKIKELKKQINIQEFKIKENKEKLDYVNSLKKLREELDEFYIQKNKILTSIDLEKDNIKILKLNEIAIPFKVDYEKFSELDSTIRESVEKVDKLNDIITQFKSEQKKMESDNQKLESEFETFKSKKEQLIDNINKTIIKDEKIEEILKDIDDINSKLEKNHKLLREMINNKKSIYNSLDDNSNRLMRLKEERKKSKFSNLDSLIVELKSENKNINKIENKILSQSNELGEFQKKKNKKELEIKEIKKNLEKSEKEVNNLNKILENIKEENVNLLKLDKIKLNAENEKLLSDIFSMEKLSTIQENIEKYNYNLTLYDKNKLIEENKKFGLLKKIDKIAEDIVEKEKIVLQLQEKWELENRIINFEEERLKLKEGLECPLCGAKKHPFVINLGKIEISQTKKNLKEQKDKFKKLVDEKNQLQNELTKCENNIEHIINDIKENEKKIENEKFKKSSLNLIHEEFLNKSYDDIRKKVDFLKKTHREINEKISIIDKLDKKIKKVDSDLENKKKEADEFIQNIKLSEKDLSNIVENSQKIENELNKSKKELENILNGINKKLIDIGIEINKHNELEKNITFLENEDIKFKNIIEKIDELEKNIIPKLRTDKAEIDGKITPLIEKEDNFTNELEKLKKKYEELKIERKKLLEDKNPQKLKKELENDEKEFLEKKKKFEKELNDIRIKISENNSILKEKKKNLENYKRDRENLFNKLNKKIIKTPFNSIDDLGKAYISEVKRMEIKEKIENLNDKKKRILSLIEDREIKIDRMKKNKKSELSEKELVEEKNILNDEFTQFMEEKGALNNKIEENKKREERQKKEIILLEKQRKISQKWSLLNELIGSKTGDKFRKFAQGLTLENLIFLANKHLSTLNNRYLLKRNEIENLKIEVMDKYQGDIIRGVENLSGGESFLISLALALGLSNLTSHQTSIDSFFLDEGFGTLDSDALSTALMALSSLRSSGKIIGIISHVEELKEIISTRIEVIPINGGISTLKIKER